VLLATILALAWILVAAYQPELASFATVESEVVLIVVLLCSALVLVSILALLEARS
jgi:hypothetical protein